MHVNNLNIFKQTVVGIQFLFVAFGATVLMPLLVGLDPATALFSAGVGTLIFHAVTKGKVPVFLGSSFAYLAPIILATEQWGLQGALSGFAGVASVYFVASLIIKFKGTNWLNRLFPPVIVGTVIILIGLSLASSAVDMAKQNWFLAFISLATASAVMFFAKGQLRLLPIILAVAVGYIAALIMGLVDYSALATAPWFTLPKNIQHFQLPQLSWQPFIFMMPIALASIVEHIGDIYVVGEVAGKDFIKNPGLHRTLLGDGLACLLGSIISGPPVTTYSEVTGAMQITKMTNPFVLRITAVTAIVFSMTGKLNAFLSSIPKAVLGGIMLLLFGTIATVGIQSMIKNKVDLSESKNIIICAVMLTTGVGGAALNMGTFSLSGIGLSAIIGIVLNLLLPDKKQSQKE
ncbi:MAG: uracil-xanthine permease [Bacteroidales bacterium]|nr:uracil-xanthine permease [Bacteroidales bacterium]